MAHRSRGQGDNGIVIWIIQLPSAHEGIKNRVASMDIGRHNPSCRYDKNQCPQVAREENKSNFDGLPDGVVCLIFSKLNLAQTVAQCSTVSRRWKDLCQTVDTLTFESFQLFENRAESKRKASCIEAVVSHMLLNTSGIRNLKITYHPVVWPWIPDDYFSEVKVCKWLEHVNGSLEKLTLVDPNLVKPQSDRLIHLSHCRKLQWLNLCYGTIPEIPGKCHRFEHLKSCLLDLIAISDVALEAFVELCPLLENLKLNSCRGLVSPQLRAPNLTRLEIVNELDGHVQSIQRVCADAPKLVQVSLSYVKELITEGQGLLEVELLCHVKPRIHALPSLISLYMNGHTWELDSISEFVRLGTNVRLLHMDVKLEAKNPLRLDYFLGHLQDLTSLYIGIDIFECLQAGVKFISAFQGLSLPHLEDITVMVTCGNEHCIAVLEIFLKCSSSLKFIRINAGPLGNSPENVMFFTWILRLQRTYPDVMITLACPDKLL